MYKIRYHSKQLNIWLDDWHTWSKFKSRIEFGNAQVYSTHLDRIEVWKFNLWKWRWEMTDVFHRKNVD